MRKTLGMSLALYLTCGAVLEGAIAPALFGTAEAQDPMPVATASAAQLDKLLAPIALYSDPLLAQVLLAATFPDQITEAADFVRAHGTGGIDEQSWDVSVKAVAHYPTILNMMDAKPEWTTELGQAYASQSTGVMDAVQRLRARANAQGNLMTTPQQQVVVEPTHIAIWPAQPQVIYVPIYDPEIIYVRHIGYYGRYPGALVYGIGFPIGPWLIYDWDWPSRRIYYTGWVGGGWIGRSRPYVRVTNIYVNDRYRDVGGYSRYASPRRYFDRGREDRGENWARGHDTFNRGPDARANRDRSRMSPPASGGRDRRGQPGPDPRGSNRGRGPYGGEQTTHQARPESRREHYVPAPQPRTAPAPQPGSAPAPQRSPGGRPGGQAGPGASHGTRVHSGPRRN